MAAKIQIPDELKHDLPPNQWGKVLGATPIIMTVIATMLAGLASSEMTKAQYDRALAAQLQSKAGDQWSYFQAKKLRSAVAHNSLEMLAAMSEVHPLDPAALSGTDPATIAALTKDELPPAPAAKFSDAVTTAVVALANFAPETEIASDLAKIKPAELAAALDAARQAALDFDNATKPINKTSDRLDDTMMNGDQKAFRDFCAAHLRYSASRYDIESRLNQAIATIYELQVRQNNISAEEHRQRSGKFFFGMLAAQFAVIVSTFAIAARKKSLLWSLAAAAGMAAVSFSVYVYLSV
jgi:hypothetical protein